MFTLELIRCNVLIEVSQFVKFSAIISFTEFGSQNELKNISLGNHNRPSNSSVRRLKSQVNVKTNIKGLNKFFRAYLTYKKSFIEMIST